VTRKCYLDNMFEKLQGRRRHPTTTLSYNYCRFSNSVSTRAALTCADADVSLHVHIDLSHVRVHFSIIPATSKPCFRSLLRVC
jgi:hypothetical protein